MASSPSPLPEVDGYPTWLAVGGAFVKCQRVLSGLLRDLDLSIAQHEILVKIHRHEGLSQKELAAHLLVVKSNVSALLRKLEARGLVSRETDGEDARRRRLTLTVEGRRLVRLSFARQNRVVHAMMSALEPHEVAALDSIMARVSSVLDA
ncbi:MAG: MarR family transcriptional regulator, partial [Acidobacteriota bacterium]